MVDPPSILDQLPVGVWVGSVPDGATAFANRACERIMGMPSVPNCGVADWSATYGLVGRDGRPYPAEKLPFPRVLATGAPVVVDDVVLVRPGGNVNLRAFGTPVHGPDGNLANVIVVFLDITAEVAAQTERKRVEDHLRFACDHAPIAIWTTDAAGVITMSEGAGLAALGVRSGQMVGQNVFDVYGAHPTIPGQLRRSLAGESFWHTTEIGKAVYHTWLAPLRGPDGAVVGLAGLSHDISELHRLQGAATQSDRMMALGTLAASVAHEINNPLTYVLAHGEQVATEVDALEKVLTSPAADVPAALASLRRLRDALGPVRSGTARIAAITGDLRTFSRPEETTLLPVDLRGVVLSVLRLVAKEVEARARLVLDLQETPSVTANEGRLVQVVLNLVVNALQALPSDSIAKNEVHVRTGHGGGQVFVEVSDSGPGVPLAVRERIFEPFFSTKEIGTGTGLGLFVCRNIVRALSGEVVVSDRRGGGACFRVTLPASNGNATPAREAPAAAAPVVPDGRHVMLIEDDSMVARALTLQLRTAGYRVTAIADGKTGMEALRARPEVDLVFCDLMMTGMNGMDLAEALAIELPEIARKVVFMTGGAFSPRARAFVARHLDRTVDKPFDVVAETRRRLEG